MMSETSKTSDNLDSDPAVDTSGDVEAKPGWRSKIPDRLLGRFRTTTVVMVVAFLVVLVLWNNVRYDPTLNENSPVYVPPEPTMTETPQQTSAPRSTSTTVTTTQPPTATVPTGVAPTAVNPTAVNPPGTQAPTAPGVTTGTRAPGFQLPTVPGLPQLPSGAN